MLLPLPAVRAALRLNTPEKRFVWAAEQLHAALFPSPAVAADLILGIPAKVANKGIVLSPPNPSLGMIIAEACSMYSSRGGFPLQFEVDFYLPFDLVQFNRGVPLLLCVGQLSTDVYPANVGTIVTGEPIPDGSVVKTFEQYLVEQFSLMVAASPTVNSDYSAFYIDVKDWYTSDYTVIGVPCIALRCLIRRTGKVGNNRYGDITTIVTSP